MNHPRYILSSGGDVIGSTGFTFLHDRQDRLFLSLVTGDKIWNMTLVDIPDGWFHATFTWHKETGLKYYQNGTLVAEKVVPLTVNIAAVEQEKHLMIGAPKLVKQHSVADLRMYGLSVWKRAILGEEVKEHMLTGTDFVFIILLFVRQ